MKRDLIRREADGDRVWAATESVSTSKRPAIITGSKGNRGFTDPIRQNPEEAFKHFFDEDAAGRQAWSPGAFYLCNGLPVR